MKFGAKGRLSWQFGLKFMLLLTVVAATFTLVFLRPQRHQQTVGGTLREITQATRWSPDSWRKDGALTGPAFYELVSPAGRRLATGQIDGPASVGHWRLHHPNGRLAAEGSCREGRPIGHWRSWDQDGRLSTEVTFSHPVPRALPMVVGQSELLKMPGCRDGQAIWLATATEEAVTFRFNNRKLVNASRLAAELTPGQFDEVIESIEEQFQSRRYRDRSHAIWRLSRLGDRGVAILIKIMGGDDDQMRDLAISALGSIGRPAAAAKGALRRLVDLPESPNWLTALLALQRVDPDSELQLLNELFVVTAKSRGKDREYVLTQQTCKHPAFFHEFLLPYVESRDRDQRRLASEYVLDGLYAMTQGESDVAREWSRDAVVSLVVFGSAAEEDLHKHCQAFVDLLERLEDDADGRIREAVSGPIKLWRSGGLRPAWRHDPYRFRFGSGF